MFACYPDLEWKVVQLTTNKAVVETLVTMELLDRYCGCGYTVELYGYTVLETDKCG